MHGSQCKQRCQSCGALPPVRAPADRADDATAGRAADPRSTARCDGPQTSPRPARSCEPQGTRPRRRGGWRAVRARSRSSQCGRSQHVAVGKPPPTLGQTFARFGRTRRHRRTDHVLLGHRLSNATRSLTDIGITRATHRRLEHAGTGARTFTPPSHTECVCQGSRGAISLRLTSGSLASPGSDSRRVKWGRSASGSANWSWSSVERRDFYGAREPVDSLAWEPRPDPRTVAVSTLFRSDSSVFEGRGG